jgi:hypothetical protein
MLLFAVTLAAWLLAMTVYIRSKFRADVITIVTPGHHCIVIACVDDKIEMISLSPWLGPRRFQWSSAAAHYDAFSSTQPEELVGPDIPGRGWPNLPSTGLNWRYFRFTKEESTRYFEGDAFALDYPWRGWDLGGPFAFDSIMKLKICDASAPVWAMPVALAILPGIWLAVAVRQSPQRCPECGVAAYTKAIENPAAL